jgi:hypothetical protein
MIPKELPALPFAPAPSREKLIQLNFDEKIALLSKKMDILSYS